MVKQLKELSIGDEFYVIPNDGPKNIFIVLSIFASPKRPQRLICKCAPMGRLKAYYFPATKSIVHINKKAS